MRKGKVKKLGTIFSIIIAISLVLWAAPTVSAESHYGLGDTGDITITLEAGQYEINQVDEYCVIDMEGFGSILNPGEPKLPSKTFLIGLPPGAEAVSVSMVVSDYAELSGEYRIVPAPPIVSLQENEKVKWEENEEIYSSENAYPSSVYEYLGMGQLRKYNFARVGFCPVAYYPASSKLGLYRSITLKIKYEITQVVPPELLSDTVMDDVASEIIFNYPSVKSQYQSATAPSAVSYDYVIVTAESLQSAVEPLVTWKTAIGYSVNVVTTSGISSNYHGRDLPEKIRNFLIDKYAEWGIEYVLIVGSNSTIPMRYCYPDPSNHTSSPDPYIDGRTPTDYYYADLTGNWDSDGDGYFGEYGQDNISYHPEVYVGRIPFDDSAIVSNFCQKSVSFEQDGGDWKKKALLLGAIDNYAGEDHDWISRTDNAVLMQECWNDILKDNGYSRERMYEKEGLSPSTYACEHPLTNSNVLNASYGWPSGYGIVNWGSHGGQTGAFRKVWSWDDGDGTPESAEMEWPRFVSSADAGSLDNSKPAIVFSCSCLTAYPENANNLGNSLLQQGAVAFIGGTRFTWYVSGWDNSLYKGLASSTDYYFFDYLVTEKRKCADAFYNAQVREYNLHWFYSWENWQNMFAFCLYGEPSLGTVSQANNPPQLSNPSVQPPSGTSSTNFYYHVNYYDSDGDSPSIKRVYIDGMLHTMSLYSGSASNGSYRYGPKNLSVGNHNYYFYFDDGKGGTARLPTSGTYSGPSVSGAGAATANRDLPTRVEPGANFDVTIEASGCGSMGQVRETLPAGFTYVSCAPDYPDYIGVEAKDSEVWFTFVDDAATFTYTVTAPTVEGTYTFAGVVVDEDLNEFAVGGDTKITVSFATATRTLPATAVVPGANFDVGIEASGCGFMGQVRETLPAGFTYVSCSDPGMGVEVTGNVVKFTFLSGAKTFTYTVTAPAAEDTYTFGGVVVDEDLNEFPVGGGTQITVRSGPWVYDENKDGIIQKSEAIHAVQDYFSQKISKAQAIEVVMLYFR